MVNPLTSNSSASLPMNPVSLDIERPALPEPARQVTPSAKVPHTGDSSQQGNTGDSMQQSLQEMNHTLKAWSTGMRFDIDPDAKRVVVSIVDNESGKVLRTVPSDAVIRIAKMIVQLQGQNIRTSV